MTGTFEAAYEEAVEIAMAMQGRRLHSAAFAHTSTAEWRASEFLLAFQSSERRVSVTRGVVSAAATTLALKLFAPLLTQPTVRLRLV